MKKLICLCLLLSGCGAEYFSARTKVTYTGKDGTTATYESAKMQEGLEVEFQEVNGKPTIVKIKVEKASTMEDAIKAAIESNVGFQDILKQLIPILQKGAMAGS